MTPAPRGLAKRAFLAVALTAGWYLLGAAISVALLWVPWAETRHHDAPTLGGLVCGFFGLLVAWSLVPPLGVFRTAPDPPPLPAGAHPRLQELISDVFTRAGLEPPRDICLLADANAFTARRWGRLWLRSWRVLGVGLPLIAALDEDELAAVIAHEIGHHHGGDVLLGPFVHRARALVAAGMDQISDANALLHWPFALYGRFFLAATASVSRQQELAADAFAARSCGGAAMASSLDVLDSLGPRWGAYWHGVYIPALAHGRRLPLLEGFRRFEQVTELRSDLREAIERARSSPPSPHDSHPPRDERIAALGGVPLRSRNATIALALLDDAAQAEAQAIDTVLADGHPPLVGTTWEALVADVLLPAWRETAEAFSGVSHPAQLPEILAAPGPVAARLRRGVSVLSPEAERRHVAAAAGEWLAAWLADRGFTIEAPPGGEVVATCNGVSLRPMQLVRELVRREVDADAFRLRLRDALARC